MTLGIMQNMHLMDKRKRQKIGSIRHFLKVAFLSLARDQIFTFLLKNNNF